MLRIITGPVGQAFHLSSFGPSDQRLLVPTATMAEHAGTEPPARGAFFPPTPFKTFPNSTAPQPPALPKSPPGPPPFQTTRSPPRLKLDSYEQVRDYPGFRAALVSQIEELTAAGVT